MREPGAYENLESETPKGVFQKDEILFLKKLLWPERRLILLALLMLILGASALLISGISLRWTIDNGLFSTEKKELENALFLFSGSILMLAVASFGRVVLVNKLADTVVGRFRLHLFKNILSANAFFIETNRSGEILTALTSDITLLHTFISVSLPIALRNFLIFLGGSIMLFTAAPTLAWRVFMLVPLIVLPIIYFGKRVKTYSFEAQKSFGNLNAIAEESIHAIKTIQAFGKETYIFKKFESANQTVAKTAMEMNIRRGLMVILVVFLVFGAIGYVLSYGRDQFLSGALSGGELTSFVFFALIVAGIMNAFSEIFSDFQRAAGAIKRFLVLDAKTSPPPQKKSFTALGSTQKENPILQFHDVVFAYPARPDQVILNNISFSVNAGEMVAIVGPSGAGKSTLYQLLLGFYKAQNGTISLYQNDLELYDHKTLRSYFAYVPQDAAIFSGTLYENIRFGRLDASQSEILETAHHAEVDSFVATFSEGYKTQVGERGIKLSGGQKQRISIARALLKEAPIPLLDEATSSLDTTSEKKVQEALEKVYHKKTVLVIAHRLSTIKNADRIIVMDKGRLVEEGNHETLMSKKGLYYSLVNVQFSE